MKSKKPKAKIVQLETLSKSTILEKESILKQAAFKWWKKISYMNLLWTTGFIMIFFAHFVIGNDSSRITSNIVLSYSIFSIFFIINALLLLFYFLKKITPINQKYNLYIYLLSLLIPGSFIAIYLFYLMEKKVFYNNQEYIELGIEKEKFNQPHTYLILLSITFVLIVISWFTSWTGNITNETSIAGIFFLFMAPIEGFIDTADLIIFLLVIGGFLSIVNESKALEAGLGRLVKKMNGKEIILVPILFILFSLGGTTYGMAEETIPFYLMLIPIFLAAGYDVFTPILIILFGAGVGVSTAILDPFIVGTAVNKSGVEGLSMSSGIIWRTVAYLFLIICGASYTTWYAYKVKKNPEKSIFFKNREYYLNEFSFNMDSLPEFTIKRKIIISIFATTFLVMIISVISWKRITGSEIFVDTNKWLEEYLPFLGGTSIKGNSLIVEWGNWYLQEMTFLFLISSILIGSLSWQGHKKFIRTFMTGVSDFISVAIVIGVSRGIKITIQHTGLDTILIAQLSSFLGTINPFLSIILIYFILILLSFLIPSTSGCGGAIFPILSPIMATLYTAGYTVSSQILTFALASGIINLASPTSGTFASAISVSKITLIDYYKGAWHIILGVVILSIIILLLGQLTNINGFASLEEANKALF